MVNERSIRREKNQLPARKQERKRIRACWFLGNRLRECFFFWEIDSRQWFGTKFSDWIPWIKQADETSRLQKSEQIKNLPFDGPFKGKQELEIKHVYNMLQDRQVNAFPLASNMTFDQRERSLTLFFDASQDRSMKAVLIVMPKQKDCSNWHTNKLFFSSFTCLIPIDGLARRVFRAKKIIYYTEIHRVCIEFDCRDRRRISTRTQSQDKKALRRHTKL